MGIENKKLDLFGCIIILVSGMVGSAIFSLSGLTISYAGPASILSWIIAAIIQLFFGLGMAELASRYSKSGGIFVFPEQTFEKNGELVGFISTWGNSFADMTAIAFSAMYVAIYLSATFPFLSKYETIIPIITIAICLLLNFINIKSTGKINSIFVVALIMILIIYSTLIFVTKSFDTNKLAPFFSQGNLGTLGFIKAIPVAMIGYSSIMSISFLAGEIENPKRNIPFSVVIGILITVFLYGITIFATVGAVSAKDLIDTNMVYVPLYAVCFTKLASFPYISYFITFAAVFALVTTIIVVIAFNGRSIKAVADKKLLPKSFSFVGKNGTPIISMTVICVVAMILSIFKNLTEEIVNLAALFAVLTRMISLFTLYISRKKCGSESSTFNAPISNPFIFILILIMICCYIPDIINGGIKLWIVTLIWELIGFFVYKFYKMRKN